MFTRDQILAADDIKIEEVIVPQWSTTDPVCVKGMTAIDRDSLERDMFNPDGKLKEGFNNLRAKVSVRTICDEKGERAFTNDEWELLANKSAAAIEIIFPLAQRLSGLSKGDVEKLQGNSLQEPKEDS